MQPRSRLLRGRAVNPDIVKLQRRIEFRRTVEALQADQYQGDKHKVYVNYQKKRNLSK